MEWILKNDAGTRRGWKWAARLKNEAKIDEARRNAEDKARDRGQDTSPRERGARHREASARQWAAEKEAPRLAGPVGAPLVLSGKGTCPASWGDTHPAPRAENPTHPSPPYA